MVGMLGGRQPRPDEHAARLRVKAGDAMQKANLAICKAHSTCQ